MREFRSSMTSVSGRSAAIPTGRRRSRVAALLLCTGLVTAAGANRASAYTLRVDDDGAQCGGAFTTIQAAVDAASSGDTIRVCPGTYSEAVTVNKTLKIKGKAPKVNTCDDLAAPDPTRYSILEAPPVPGIPGIGIDITANDVQVKSMVITHAGEVGIRTDAAYSGFKLKKSVFVANVNGIYFHSSGTKVSQVKANCFSGLGAVTPDGATGIRSRYGLHDVQIVQNRFHKNLNSAIVLDHEAPYSNTEILVKKNQSNGDGTFAVVLHTADSSITRNTIDSTVGTSLFIARDNTNLEISSNRVTNAGTRAIRFNNSVFVGSPSTGVEVTKNFVENAGLHGIVADSSGGGSALVSSKIEGNTVLDSGDGGSGDGIRISGSGPGTNAGNSVRDNIVANSANHDCHDSTSGAGTAGTASTWQSNQATTQNLANLCGPFGILNGPGGAD